MDYQSTREYTKMHWLYYGGCLSRLIHYIISMRLRHPTIRILGGKSDFKAVYRRVNSFGGSLCPNEFCVASELCTDLANDLLHCPDWQPEKVHSPHSNLILDPLLLEDSVPFRQAKELDIDIPVDDWGRIDDFIDDGIAIVPDIGNNRNRAIQAMLLAIHTICRP